MHGFVLSRAARQRSSRPTQTPNLSVQNSEPTSPSSFLVPPARPWPYVIVITITLSHTTLHSHLTVPASFYHSRRALLSQLKALSIWPYNPSWLPGPSAQRLFTLMLCGIKQAQASAFTLALAAVQHHSLLTSNNQHSRSLSSMSLCYHALMP